MQITPLAQLNLPLTYIAAHHGFYMQRGVAGRAPRYYSYIIVYVKLQFHFRELQLLFVPETACHLGKFMSLAKELGLRRGAAVVVMKRRRVLRFVLTKTLLRFI